MPMMLIPKANDIGKLLSDLLGRDVTLTPAAQPLKVERANPKLHTALYLTTRRTAPAIVSCDKSFAASSGAALAMIPAVVVGEWMAQQKLPAEATENLYEVLNVFAATINGANLVTNHVKLAAVLPPGKAVPAAVSVVERHAARVDYTVDIDGYAPGQLSILTA